MKAVKLGLHTEFTYVYVHNSYLLLNRFSLPIYRPAKVSPEKPFTVRLIAMEYMISTQVLLETVSPGIL